MPIDYLWWVFEVFQEGTTYETLINRQGGGAFGAPTVFSSYRLRRHEDIPMVEYYYEEICNNGRLSANKCETVYTVKTSTQVINKQTIAIIYMSFIFQNVIHSSRNNSTEPREAPSPRDFCSRRVPRPGVAYTLIQVI